jgi:hypothetical protein
MKKFIYMTVIFGAALIVAASVLDFAVSYSARKSNVYLLQGWNEIYYGNTSYDLLIMGSSRGWVQYSPLILDSVLGVNSYNLGLDGRPIDTQILKYNTYRRFKEKPSYIIQNIDVFSMRRRSGFNRHQFYPYFYDSILREKSSEIEDWSWAQKYIPWYRYASREGLSILKAGIGATLGLKHKNNPVKGYTAREEIWDGSRIPEEEIDYNWDPVALSYFEEYLSKAKAENIKVILVYAPLHILGMEKIKDVEGLFFKYDSIARKYDIPVLNYTYDPISYDTAYFYNATHLNKLGSELFTRKLAEDIASLELLK